jgi:hypothetical protein
VLNRCTSLAVAPDEEVDVLQDAQNRERAALDEYMHALKVFHELVVEGKRPT